MAAVDAQPPPELGRGRGCRAAAADPDIVELNVGGVKMATLREVLTLAQGSQLADMFSSEAMGHLRDRDGAIIVDADPALFAKILSFLRLCRIAAPGAPAPLPHVPSDLRPRYNKLVEEFGLSSFMYGAKGCDLDVPQEGDICKILATSHNADQARLQSEGLAEVKISTSAGAPERFHEEVLSAEGLFGVALENSYGTPSSWLRVRFPRHKVRVDALRMRVKAADAARMSDSWEFIQGSCRTTMRYHFTWCDVDSGRLAVSRPESSPFVQEVIWRFAGDFCIEHIRLFGQVLPA